VEGAAEGSGGGGRGKWRGGRGKWRGGRGKWRGRQREVEAAAEGSGGVGKGKVLLPALKALIHCVERNWMAILVRRRVEVLSVLETPVLGCGETC
jgi:hypothetical protein